MGRLPYQSGKSGYVTKYVSRNQALKKLQLCLADFRRLCILKGVYPRVPEKVPSKNSKTTWYHVNDIKFLAHDPIVETLRAVATHEKKVAKKFGRRETELGDALLERMPQYNLDHLVKERYPSFEACLRDIDDCISTIHLYASLQTDKVLNVPNEVILNCQRLAREWDYAVARLGAIKKAFISIKGTYLQANMHNIDITWVIPHKFTPVLPEKVDYRVMSTFLEFYQCQLGFALYQIYSEMGESYPPNLNVDADSNGLWLGALPPFNVEKGLFSGLKMAIGRESKYEWLDLVLRASGANVTEEGDSGITHIVTDRPISRKLPKIIYVQPQYIADCLNNTHILRPEEYSPGKQLPDHLSPFVDNVKEGYLPDRQLELDAQLGKETEEVEQDIIDDEFLEAQETMLNKKSRWLYERAKLTEEGNKKRAELLESRKVKK